MKKLLFLLMLAVVTTMQAQTQTGISGDWRAVSVISDGTPDAVVREFNLEVQLAVQGRPSRVLSPAIAREMITPVGVGSFAVGFGLAKQGEGWYFEHGGSNYGFRCDLMAHLTKGYGSVIMTNGSGGDGLIPRLVQMIQQGYKWDTLDQPIPRQYGP